VEGCEDLIEKTLLSLLANIIIDFHHPPAIVDNIIIVVDLLSMGIFKPYDGLLKSDLNQGVT